MGSNPASPTPATASAVAESLFRGRNPPSDVGVHRGMVVVAIAVWAAVAVVLALLLGRVIRSADQG